MPLHSGSGLIELVEFFRQGVPKPFPNALRSLFLTASLAPVLTGLSLEQCHSGILANTAILTASAPDPDSSGVSR